MRFLNYTPHDINIYTSADAAEPVLTLPSQGVARVESTVVQSGMTVIGECDIPLFQTQFGELIGLPEPCPETCYIVSALVHNAAKARGRTDTCVPAQQLRGTSGQVYGCMGFSF